MKQKKHVIVNGRFLLHRVTGVERYAREILPELDKKLSPGMVELAVPPGVGALPVFQNIQIVRVGRLKDRLWEHISFPIYVWKKRSVSLNLCNVAPLPSPGIVAIHDVKIKSRPDDFSKQFLIWYSLLFKNATRRAKKIITVSEFSKKEIVKYYNVDSDRIVVIPPVLEHYKRIGYDDETPEKFGLKKGDYFFSLSSIEPNKNFKWIAEAAKKNSDQSFAVAGSINNTVFAEGLGFKCPDNMKLLGYVSDEEAKSLMRDCKAFLFPSYYEGFGLPPIEALSAGAPQVVVADIPVMHENLGDDVIYIDPDSDGVMPDKICVIRDKNSILNRFKLTESAMKLYKLLEETY